MNKVVNYIKYCGGTLVDNSNDSHYYLLDNKIIRVSNHIGLNSSGNIQIICGKHGYFLYNKTTGAIDVISYEDLKCFIRNAHLLSAMSVNCDGSQNLYDKYTQDSFKRSDFTDKQIKQIESFIKENYKNNNIK